MGYEKVRQSVLSQKLVMQTCDLKFGKNYMSWLKKANMSLSCWVPQARMGKGWARSAAGCLDEPEDGCMQRMWTHGEQSLQ